MVDEIRASGVNYGTSPVVRAATISRDTAATSSSIVQVDDTAEFSELATLRSKYDQMPPIRSELVSQVRKEIANGTYETPEKLDQAIENLLEDLA